MKKRIALLAAFSLALSAVPIQAEELAQEETFEEVQIALSADAPTLYGRYPASEDYVLGKAPVKIESTMTPGKSPAENVFTIDDNGKKTSYVLLDKDDEGNYFVITETEFGQKAFTSLGATDINQHTTTDSLWYYNPQSKSNIAYWLNNGFLLNGNGGAILPDSIKNNILEREWLVENNIPANMGKALNASAKEKAAQFEALQTNEVRTVTSKISLLSMTEYKAYADKISAPGTRTVEVDKPLGFMLRTIRTVIGGAVSKPTFNGHVLHICGANNQSYVTCEVESNFDSNYYVRPVFWLDKDFFKNEKIELSTAGENVKAEVKTHLYADLTYVYTDDELLNIGIDATELPKAEEVVVSGLKMPGSTPEIEYAYTGSDNENESVYEIYSVGENDALTLEDTQTGNWTIPETLIGKNVKIAVIPADENGNMGARAWSNTFKVADAVGAVVSESKFKDGDSNPVTALSALSKLTAEVKVKNADTAEMPCTVIIAQYNSANQIKAMNISSVTAVNGDNTFEASLENVTAEAGDYVRVMVRANLRPIYSNVIK